MKAIATAWCRAPKKSSTLWEDTLLKLKARELCRPCAAHRLAVETAACSSAPCSQRPELNWRSPEIKHLDFLYSSLDLSDGLYWAYEKAGAVERLVSDEEIERFVQDPPEDTRAYTRAMLLRKVDPEKIDDVDWDSVRFAQDRNGRMAARTRRSTWPILSRLPGRDRKDLPKERKT